MDRTVDLPVHTEYGPPAYVAPAVERIATLFVNAYLVGERAGPWVLVDTGLRRLLRVVMRAARERFDDRPPEAIVLTHGHFDHAGSAAALAARWDVPVYAHELELPHLTGRSDYPPQDPTVGGALGFMSRTFPHKSIDLGERVRALPANGTVPGLPDWRWIHTPGHTSGHVSLFREMDGVLLAGDALATVDQDSAIAMVTQHPVFSVPPAPLTTDWDAAQESVRRLAELSPVALAAGHGRPVRGPRIAADLERFADAFPRPRRGRYVREAARSDESGIVYVPPAVHDPLPRRLLVGGVAAAALIALARRRH